MYSVNYLNFHIISSVEQIGEQDMQHVLTTAKNENVTESRCLSCRTVELHFIERHTKKKTSCLH